MGKKKPIDCPEELGGCGDTCIEVGHVIGYPKPTYEKRPIALGKPTQRNIGGHEYRYACPKCGKEWIHDTLDRDIFKIPEDSQYYVKIVNGEEIIGVNWESTMESFGLPPEGRNEFTVQQIRDLMKKSDLKIREWAIEKAKVISNNT